MDSLQKSSQIGIAHIGIYIELIINTEKSLLI